MAKLSELRRTNEIAYDGTGFDSAEVLEISGSGLQVYSTLDSLPMSSLIKGDQAYIQSNNRLYISNGSGWYNVGLVNATPTLTVSNGSIVLDKLGSTTTITLTATDSDTPLLGLTYTVESDGNFYGLATLSQDSSVFTITPRSEDSATTTTATLTFKANDGINFSTDTTDFELTFSNIIDSSSPTVLLLKADGNSATNANITYQNSSDVSTGFTEAGNPQASTFSPYRSGGYSAYFDGSSDALVISDNTDLQLGTGEFTIECWVYFNDVSGIYGVFAKRNSTSAYWRILVNNGNLNFRTSNLAEVSISTVVTEKWYHISVTRDSSSNLRFFVNGNLENTSSNFTENINYVGADVRIGEYQASQGNLPGYVVDARIIKGTCLHTANFTPPTESLTAISGTTLLACHLPYFADGSTNNHEITVSGDVHTVPFGPYDYEPWSANDVGGSVYFDGSGDYIDATVGTAPGTGDFTYEGWIRCPNTATGSNQCIFDTSTDGFGTGGLELQVGTGGEFGALSDGGGVAVFYLGSGQSYFNDTWHHFAAVRNSGSLSFYIDGVLKSGPHSFTRNISSTNLRLGYNRRSTPTEPYIGQIADFRYTRSAVYTAAFTPPTAPLGHITNTQVLMNNKSDANVYDAAAANTLTLVGNTQSSTAQRKFATSSAVYFDGSGDYIETDFTRLLGAGDFTIEGWVRWGGNTENYFLDFQGTNRLSLWYVNTTGSSAQEKSFVAYDNAYRGLLNSASYATVYNNWNHIAWVRSSGTITMYLNGVSKYSWSSNLDYSDATLTIGNTDPARTFDFHWLGYMQDIRITNGLARYTANFTPTTAEFEL